MAAVTIAMPVLNGEQTVGAALRSMVRQDFDDWELLLIDDGCTDKTVEIAKSFSDRRISVLSDGRSLGLIGRLNQAIEQARGRYFARMDGDDIAYPERLAHQWDFLTRYPDVDLVGAGMLVFGSEGKPLGTRIPPPAHGSICRKPHAGFGLSHPTYCGKLAWFQRFRYRPGAVLCEDQDLLLRSYEHSRFANLPEILLGYREPSLRLSKLLRTRYFFARAVVAHYAPTWSLVPLARGLTGQAAKAAVDTLAVGSGLNYTVLRHRANRATNAEVARWDSVYLWATG
jgi:glycosyltransferase involved in cell wall biosynthesis